MEFGLGPGAEAVLMLTIEWSKGEVPRWVDFILHSP